MSRRAAILSVSLALAPETSALAQTPAAASLRLSQAVQVDASTPTLRVYVDVLDADGEPIPVHAPEALTATIGEAAAETTGVETLATSSEGVAYIFLVDVSRSLSSQEFDSIRGAIDLWVDSLGPADRVAVIAFGEASRVELDFTNDYGATREALARLGPTDDLTVFHRALRDGLELARRRDAGLPGRRVLVVLSDGKDEGSGLTTDDVLATLRADPVPIYAIGFSRLRSESERSRYLALLNRLASISGGAYVEAAQTTVERSYAAMLNAARRVWVATFTCADCRLDGESYRLQVHLADGARVLSAGRQIRLLPGHRGTAAALVPPAVEPTAAPVAAPEEVGDAPAGDVPEKTGGRWWWIVLLLLPVAALFVWLRSRRPTGVEDGEQDPGEDAAQTSETPLAAEPTAGTPTAPTFSTPTGVLTSRPPKPPMLRLVRLIVVRGRRVGHQYSLMLLERGVVGARSTCDCVLVDEPGVEAEQFELSQIDGRVYIRDLARQRHTLRDGLPIDGHEPLDSPTLVGNSDWILRVLYDEPRRVPL